MLLAACLNGKPLPGGAKAPEALDEDGELAKAIRRYIKEQLADPDLGPDTICRQFALSRGRLYRLMRGSGTIATTIRRLRLVHAYGEIVAGRYTGSSAEVVAARSGFRQERSFRRAFVQEFSLSPAALQAKAETGLRTPLPASGLVIADWFNDL